MKQAAVAVIVLSAVWASAALAQQASSARPGPQAGRPQPEARTKAGPNPDIQRVINSLQGAWTIAAKLGPTPKMPGGDQGKGTEKWRPGPGNGSVIEEVHLSTAAWELDLMAISWWDEQAHGIRSLVCANLTPPGCWIETEMGKWEGNRLVFESEFERNGRRYKYREVWLDIKATSFTQTRYEGEAGGELKLTQTIQARRELSSERPH